MKSPKEGRISKVYTFFNNFIKFETVKLYLVCYIIIFFGLWSTFDCNNMEWLNWPVDMNYWLNCLTDQSTLYDCMVVWVSDWLIKIICLTEKMIDWPHIGIPYRRLLWLLAKWIRNSVQNQTPVVIHLSGQDSRTMGIKWKNSDQVSTMLRRQCQITTLGAHTNKDYSSRGLFNNINFAIIIFSHFDIHKRQSATYIEGLLYLALFYLTVGWGKIEC